ncbi:MAG: hypothetical protein NKF70_13555 [Methanobacterium sp. ERen5]|nr:MAG: hypothetical protein NKF70_13555 [Methanobacterium sp. ERen5]
MRDNTTNDTIINGESSTKKGLKYTAISVGVLGTTLLIGGGIVLATAFGSVVSGLGGLVSMSEMASIWGTTIFSAVTAYASVASAIGLTLLSVGAIAAVVAIGFLCAYLAVCYL